MTEQGFARFAQQLKHEHGLDLSLYKEAQIKRRLLSYMQRYSVADYGGLTHYISSAEKRSHLVDYLDINVSEFFRNPELFVYLEQEVFRRLTAKQRSLRVWSAGCSIGAEPYSLAIALAEARIALSRGIWGTDLDAGALHQAAQGLYNVADVRNVGDSRRERYFDLENGNFRVKQLLKSMIEFQRHDLLCDPIPHRFDLVVCRNVAIYFTEEAKLAMLKRFSDCLLPGGVLFTGATESYPTHHTFGFRRIHSCFYEKVGD
ncbi:MAG: Chemotaxis protein methyltransferase [Firmicutes bacterium]|nr:Chemotaxis protein methyltransferase [candidate division NPL-UPA2 bacterium]